MLRLRERLGPHRCLAVPQCVGIEVLAGAVLSIRVCIRVDVLVPQELLEVDRFIDPRRYH